MRRRHGAAAMVVLASCGPAVEAPGPPPEPRGSGWGQARIERLRGRMPGLLREHAVPGVAVVLTSGSEVAWAAGFGVAGPGGEAITPRSVFQVASLGKPVFAHLVDRVASSSAWSLEDPLEAWAPRGSVPPVARGLRAAALLSHTSGIVYDEAADGLVVDSAAAGGWRYSGTGYVVLQRALEGAEGRGLDEVAREVLFEPLGLASMTYRPVAEPARVRGHDRSGAPLPARDPPAPNAGSSLRASALDYARFLRHVAGTARAPAPSPWTRLARPRIPVRPDLGLHWGLGWALERDPRGGITAFHWGSNPGFKSFALVDPKRGLGLVILTNGDHGLELAEEVVAILDPKPHPLFEFYMLHPDD